jgi:hypothetical protein
LSKEKKEIFEETVPRTLASRIIGGFYDATKENLNDFDCHFRLWEKYKKEIRV